MSHRSPPSSEELVAVANTMPRGWGVEEYPNYIERIVAWHQRTQLAEREALGDAEGLPRPPSGWGTRRHPDPLLRRKAWAAELDRQPQPLRSAAHVLALRPFGPELPPELVERRARLTSEREASERARKKKEIRAGRDSGELVFRREALALGYSQEVVDRVEGTRPGDAGPWYYARVDLEVIRRRVDEEAERRAASICRRDLLRLLPRKVVDGMQPDWTETWTYHGAGSGERYWYLLERVQSLIDAHKRDGDAS